MTQYTTRDDSKTSFVRNENAKAAESFDIPEDAKFEKRSCGIEQDQKGSYEIQFCKAHEPTVNEIKEQFHFARRLQGRELHDLYLWTPCVCDGVIVQNGKTMKWRFRVGNVIETSFPDGIQKTLGGEVSDVQ